MHKVVLRAWSRCFLALLFLGGLTAGFSQSPVIISEFAAASNSGLLDNDGEPSDWIEIFNASGSTVNLLGWNLTDDASDLTKWTFPATNLPAKTFMVIFASGKNRITPGLPLHTSFSLSASGEYLALVEPDGLTVATEFAPTFPSQHSGFTYGLVQSVVTNQLIGSNAPVRVLVPTSGTLGTTWVNRTFVDSSWIAGTNGVGYETSVPGFAVRNFKAGPGLLIDTIAKAETLIATPSQQAGAYAENSPVVNYFNTGSPGHYGLDRTFPGFSINVDQEDFVTEAVGTITIPAAGNWTFGVNSDDGFRLVIGSTTEICDCLRGPADTLQTFNFPAAGDYPLRLVFFERGGGSEVELFAAQGSFGGWAGNFILVGDTANGGLAVRSPPVAGGSGGGYGGSIRTDVGSSMLNQNASAYVRIPFTISNPAAISALTLSVRYDDGFIAYLNGAEVARRNAPSSAQWNSTATATHTGVVPEDISLSDRLNLLVTGNNVLALHGLNDAPDGSDFLIQATLAELKVSSVSPTNYQYFSAPSPGAANANPPAAGFVSDTKFSFDRGFYDTNFSLAITCNTPGATIYYTFNGSIPSPVNGFVYTTPLLVTNTTTLRAVAYKNGLYPSDVDTETYIFLNDVIRQKERVAPGPGWPAPRGRGTGLQTYDYGMDSNVVNSAAVAPTIINDLKSLPTFSIVADLYDVFDPGNGFYSNPGGDTIAWERPCSAELIYPDGSNGFQINAGIRIRGGYSRSPDNPKHGLRLFFREEYGAGSLKFPVFGPTGLNELEKFDLRTFQNYSWSFEGDARFTGMRDVFSRDAQLAMSGMGSRGNYFHLYLNGAYWGIYNTDERPEANFGAGYFGGDATNYDTIKVSPDDGYIIYATDGDMNAWTRLWMQATNGLTSNADYFRVQGMNPDGSPNPAYENLIDVDNLIDYMLVILYGGNLDAPISNFLGNSSPNNFFGFRDRTGAHGGFRFVAHDSEHTLLDVNASRIGPYSAGAPGGGGGLSKSNPQYIWQRMWGNPEFQIKVADHAQKHFFNGGALTASNATGRFLARSNEIYQAINAESARWGNANHSPSYTRTTWLNTMRSIGATFLSQRGPIVLNQLRSKGLFPPVTAPDLSRFGGLVPPGFSLFVTNPNPSGAIYYTIDGSDPRQVGGFVSSTAIPYTPGTPISIDSSQVIHVRVLNGSAWSPLIETTFYTAQDFTPLRVTEIMYNPPSFGVTPGDQLEFLELKNTGPIDLDLSGLSFTSGISFTFTNGTHLAPGAFFLLGRDALALDNRYPGVAVNGIYSGKLDNAGETITLSHPLGGKIFSFDYNNSGAWPITPGGFGFSLVANGTGTNINPGSPISWRASTNPGGSPGADDPASSIQPIVINEILANSPPPDVDRIELYNPNSGSVSVGGWWLTDDAKVPKKYRIPNSTSIAGGSYLVLSEADFNPTPGTNNSFAVSSTGDDVYLFSGDTSTNLTGYSHGFKFDASPTAVTFGRFTNSVGEEKFELLTAPTFPGQNAAPIVGPVVIDRIMFHPPDIGTNDNVADEFIEISNTSGALVNLFDPAAATNTWHLRGSVDFDFPQGISLNPGASLLLVSINPADNAAVAAFRAKYSSLSGVPLYGPFTGRLENDHGTVEIKRPDVPTTNGVAYIRVDQINYRDRAPWPPGADGSGAALRRVSLLAYGDDPANWIASRPLVILAQPTNVVTLIGSNVTFAVDAAGDGALIYQWRVNGAPLADGPDVSGANTASLLLANVQPAMQGNFTVDISDQSGTLTTVPASLIVRVPPTILVHPQSQTVLEGSDVTLSVQVTNLATTPITYEWRFQSRPIQTNVSSQFSDSFVVTSVPTNFPPSAIFEVAVQNAAIGYPGLLSAPASIIVLADQDRDGMADVWEKQFGFSSTDAADATLDFDGDGMTNLAEYRAGTDPTDPSSYLRIDEMETFGLAASLQFVAVSNRTYSVQFRDSLSTGSWIDWTNIPPAGTNRTIVLTNAPLTAPQRYYRLVLP